MKFYTGHGDNGTSTFLGSSARFSKTDSRFEALGALDELNSYLGICRSLAQDEEINAVLKQVQENLFIIQAEVGSIGAMAVEPFSDAQVKELEKIIDDFGNEVGEIKKFVLSGGRPLSAHLDFARALARTIERRTVALKDKISFSTFAYLNRLSSLLFILARLVNKRENRKEDHPIYKSR